MFHMDYPVVHTVGQMEMDIGYLYTDGKRNHKTATRPEPSLGQIGLHRVVPQTKVQISRTKTSN